MAEITECFEENGIKVDQDVIRRAVVNENKTKYMSQIEKDLEEDRNYQKETDFISLQQRRDNNSLFDNINSGRKAGGESKMRETSLTFMKVNSELGENTQQSGQGDEMAGHKEGFQASPWDES